MFAETAATASASSSTAALGRVEGPAMSRTNSRQSRGNSRMGTTAAGPTSVTFAEPQRDQKNAQAPYRPHLSRHSSTPVIQVTNSSDPGSGDDEQHVAADEHSTGDVRIGIAGLLADYKTQQHHGDGENGGNSGNGGNGGNGENGENGANPKDDNDDDSASRSSGSSYATQGLSLSFNDLPRRAQHLILNELMRQQSTGKGKNDGKGDGTGGSAGVLFTTLPIPDDGTCRSETASLQYLADVELLCQGLPPVLMILSNNMTVTVSL